MGIAEIKAKKVFGGPGNFIYVAEALAVDESGCERYVTVQWYDEEMYTVQEKSVYDFLTGDGGDPDVTMIEEYSTWKEAGKSEYADIFKVLRGIIRKLG